MNKSILLVIFFIYIYPFTLNSIPISTRTWCAIAGLILLPSAFINYKDSKYLTQSIKILTLATPFIILNLMTIIFNGTLDHEFSKIILPIFSSCLGAFFILKVSSFLKIEITKETAINLIIFSNIIQICLSLYSFLNPEFQNLLNQIIKHDPLKTEKIEALQDFRIIGFSRAFFSSGIYCGLSLILLGYSIREFDNSRAKNIFNTIIFIFIFSFGMLLSRTTIVGAALGFILILLPNRKNNTSKEIRKYIKIFFITFLASAILLIFHIIEFSEKLSTALSFGFELFINIITNEGLKTNSTEILKSMFVLPETLKTWLIGDGLWNIDDGMHYYMDTDVGYLRTIYFFGIFGCIYFLWYNSYLIIKSSPSKFLAYALILYLLILNIKGYAEFFSFSILTYILINKNASKS